MPAAMHGLLVAVLFSLGIVAIWETRGLGRAVGLWIRSGLMILTGTWFIQIAYSLYVVGFDPNDPQGKARVFLYFSWHVLSITAALAALQVSLRSRLDTEETLGPPI